MWNPQLTVVLFLYFIASLVSSTFFESNHETDKQNSRNLRHFSHSKTWKEHAEKPHASDYLSDLERELKALQHLPRLKSLRNSSLPRRFDARKKWKYCADLMSTVWNQGPCYSSSVMAVASMASDRLCIKTKGKFHKTLSAQYLMACSSSCDRRETVFTPIKFIGRHGIPTGGSVFESGDHRTGCVPFEVRPCEQHSMNVTGGLAPCNYSDAAHHFTCPVNCTNSVYDVPMDEDQHRFRIMYRIDDFDNEEAMRKDIHRYGPIAASFVMFSDFFEYKVGVYHHSGYGPYEKIQTVKLIGWGVASGKPYWLAVNSFGSEWGKNGTFKFERGRNHLHIESMAAAARF